MKATNLLILIFLIACESQGPREQNVELVDKKFLSLPDADDIQFSNQDLSIAIINELQGREHPFSLSTPAGTMRIGGSLVAKSYLHHLRTLSKNKLITLVTGDSIQGSLKSDASQGQDFIEEINSLQANLISLSWQNFSLTPPPGMVNKYLSPQVALKRNIARLNAPVLISNLYKIESSNLPRWKNLVNYKIIKKNNFKIGFLSVIDPQFTTQMNNDAKAGFYFDKMIRSTLLFSQKLKSLGADKVILLAQGQQICGRIEAIQQGVPLDRLKLKSADLQLQCDKNGSFYQLLELLPKGSIDVAILSNDSDISFKTTINAVPTISSGKQSLNIVQFKNKKVVTHPPVKLCLEHLSSTQSCFPYSDDKKDNIIPAKFLGKEVKVKSHLNDYQNIYFKKKAKNLINTNQFIEDIAKNRTIIMLKDDIKTSKEVIEKYGDISEFIKYQSEYKTIKVTGEQLEIILRTVNDMFLDTIVVGEVISGEINDNDEYMVKLSSYLIGHLYHLPFLSNEIFYQKRHKLFHNFARKYF